MVCNMQGPSRYILGLDLGTSSVGFALVRVPENEGLSEIVRLGVRKFNEVYVQGDSSEKKKALALAPTQSKP
jgi:CRISPR/Cas system Type II protein with McrA/HNH and RuvC-like nuclease domain